MSKITISVKQPARSFATHIDLPSCYFYKMILTLWAIIWIYKIHPVLWKGYRTLYWTILWNKNSLKAACIKIKYLFTISETSTVLKDFLLETENLTLISGFLTWIEKGERRFFPVPTLSGGPITKGVLPAMPLPWGTT